MAENAPRDEALLPGLKPVLELLHTAPDRIDQVFLRKGRHGEESTKILDMCRQHGVRFALVPEDALRRMANNVRHQGVLARLRETPRYEWRDLLAQAPHAPLPLLVALDQVQDPRNLGTLARTLYALGGAGLVLPRHNSAFLGTAARKAAAGALEYLPLAEVVNLSRAVAEARDAGFHTYAAQLRPQAVNAFVDSLTLPALLVLGNEEVGIRPGVAKHCESGLAIPFLRDFDSLNVAQAGGILISCFARSAL